MRLTTKKKFLKSILGGHYLGHRTNLELRFLTFVKKEILFLVTNELVLLDDLSVST